MMSQTNEASDSPTILIVDDTPDNLLLMDKLLRAQRQYRTKVANNGETALRVARGDPKPDLILLDVMMPGMDGYEVCRRLKAEVETEDIPVIFLTARTEVEDEHRGFEVGAVDYIAKPISPPIVLARVKCQLQLKSVRDFLTDKSAFLEAEVLRRMNEVSAAQDATIAALTALAETRDGDTGRHIQRTQHYMRALAYELREHPRFASELSDSRIEILFKAAPLHDIGKVGIRDHILLKPASLSDDEFADMKRHTILGDQALAQAEASLSAPSEFLRCAREIARSHQEWWDGSGYPDQLKGEAIPLSARLMAVADVYDALISKRPYKGRWSHDEAVAAILDSRGRHFDPDVTDAFKGIADVFSEIAHRLPDPDNAAH